MHGLQKLYDENASIIGCLENSSVPLLRKTLDKTVNTYGHSLLELCKNNDLFMLNGRIGKDAVNPKLTCEEKILVDCILSSAHLFCKFTDFQVHEFVSLYSDAHCPISFSIDITDTNGHTNAEKENLLRPKLWNQNKAEESINNIDLIRISEIDNILIVLLIVTEWHLMI